MRKEYKKPPEVKWYAEEALKGEFHRRNLEVEVRVGKRITGPIEGN